MSATPFTPTPTATSRRRSVLVPRVGDNRARDQEFRTRRGVRRRIPLRYAQTFDSIRDRRRRITSTNLTAPTPSPTTSAPSAKSQPCSGSAPTWSTTGSKATTSRPAADRQAGSTSPSARTSRPRAAPGSLPRSTSTTIPEPHSPCTRRLYAAIVPTVKDRVAQQTAKIVLEPDHELERVRQEYNSVRLHASLG